MLAQQALHPLNYFPELQILTQQSGLVRDDCRMPSPRSTEYLVYHTELGLSSALVKCHLSGLGWPETAPTRCYL